MARPPRSKTATSSSHPVDLEARLEAALAQRDAALLELAEAREQVNALRLAAARKGEADPPLYPQGTALGPPPLRYTLVDSVHGIVKSAWGRIPLVGRRVRR